jgi:hypothetical protein
MRLRSFATRFSITVLLLLTATGSRVAHAQAKIVETDAPKGAEETDVSGWNPFLGLTSTLSLVDNTSVIGQVDGFSTLFGLGLLGGADYTNGKSLLRTSLNANEGFARTPVVDRFIKTSDNVKLESLYNYFVDPHFGGYGRLSFATSILETRDVRGIPTTWVDTTGMTPTPLRTNSFSQKLSSPFKPFTIGESIGAFTDPVRSEKFSLSFRLGLGGRHTFADNVYVNKDDKMTPEIELLRLSDVHQLGVEAFAGATGKLDQGKANYRAGVAALLPFVNNDSFDRSPTFLTRVAFEGNFSYAMSSWLAFVYSVSVTRDPQLFPKDKELLQVQNTFLLTFQMSLVKKREKAKAPSKEEVELQSAKQRADDAERRAKEAEERIRQLQTPAPPPAPNPGTLGPDTQPPTPEPAPTP